MKKTLKSIFFIILIITMSIFLFGCSKNNDDELEEYLQTYIDQKNHDLSSLSEMFQLEDKRADRKKLMVSKGIDDDKIKKLLEKEEKTDDKLVSLMQLNYKVLDIKDSDQKVFYKIKLTYMDIKHYNEDMAKINAEANEKLSSPNVSGKEYYSVMDKLLGKINKALKTKTQKITLVFVKTNKGYEINKESDEIINEIITHG